MNKTTKILVLSVSVCFLSTMVHAELAFVKKHLFKKAPADAKVLKVEFSFVNKGKKDVKILDLKALCDCMGYEAKPVVVPPGGKGTIKVAFDLQGFQGRFRKEVFVKASDRKDFYKLSIGTEMPVLVKVAPWKKTWDVGEKPAFKEVVLSSLSGKSIKVKGKIRQRKNWKLTPEVRENGSIVIKIIPKSTVAAEKVWFAAFIECQNGRLVKMRFCGEVMKRP